MDRDYDIFERGPNGPVWRCAVTGRENALLKLSELAASTTNEVFIMYLPEREVIARANPSGGNTV